MILLDESRPAYAFAPSNQIKSKNMPSSSSTLLSSSPSDDEFMKDLENAKQKLGTSMSSIPIPDDFESKDLTAAADNAQNDFLAAMKVVSEEFKIEKERLGVDGAINLFQSQWDLEDRLIDVKDEDLNGEFE